MSTVSREILIREPYLRLPVQNGAPMRFVRFSVDGAPVREFEIELASGAPDFWVFADARPFLGQRLE
ncbi:MAG: glycoside hydrolase family 32 protein, partial [Chloroflexota bacterium]|nr:glycoside hydrolase family 32 protein [Chloroflexota bacterium]